jgi:Glycosyl transferase family 2
MHFCFVSTRRGSYFMTELLSAVSAATAAAGHTVELAFDEFPPLRDDLVYVVIPHEFQAWGNRGGSPGARQRSRTIALCTENPGTEWFEATYQLVPEFAAAVSINLSSAAELRRRGIRCEHLQLGYSPLWDSWRRDGRMERGIDVLYLGAADPRRDPLLAGFGGDLWSRECQLLIPPLEPRTGPRPDFLKEADKYRRLRSAKVLLNLHRTTSSALEWMRFLEAICNGCVVVSEPCLDNEPLLPGEHFVATGVDGITSAVNRLLDEPDSLQLLRERAYDFVREELPMGPAGERLAALATELPLQPRGTEGGSTSSEPQTVSGSRPPENPAPADALPPAQQSVPDEARSPLEVGQSPLSVNTRAPHRLLRRISDRVLGGRGHGVRILGQTESYAVATPRVSIITLFASSREREVVEALISVAASHYRDLEVLVLGDASTDGSGPRLNGFLDERPELPTVLLGQRVNRGLAHSRNVQIGWARGEYVFVLDAEGGIYPSTVGRLVKALDADPQAIFSYPMIAVLDGERPLELRSSLPWEPQRLTRGNWIDAMALIRRRRLLELGGYSTDPRVAGSEDLDLWCKCAEAGGHGEHVPQVLGWHRPPTITPPAHGEPLPPATAAYMRERFPRLFAVSDAA